MNQSSSPNKYPCDNCARANTDFCNLLLCGDYIAYCKNDDEKKSESEQRKSSSSNDE